VTLISYSLEAAAKQIRGSSNPGDVQWLSRQLRWGVLEGYKVGRKWRMTDVQIDAAIETLRPKRVSLPNIPVMAGMTKTSRRRMAS
jgi:very-short-patch-repair endonuclease